MPWCDSGGGRLGLERGLEEGGRVMEEGNNSLVLGLGSEGRGGGGIGKGRVIVCICNTGIFGGITS